jgi:hypothetical protein
LYCRAQAVRAARARAIIFKNSKKKIKTPGAVVFFLTPRPPENDA